MAPKNRYSGLDTETIGGYAVVLSTEHRAWQAHTFETCVNPLFNQERKGNLNSHLVLYNLDYDVRAILKYLPAVKLKEFTTNLDRFGNPSNTINYDNYRITYIPSKLFTISKNKHKLSFFDLAQFFNYNGLDNDAQAYLGDKKMHDEITEYITSHAQEHTDNELDWYFAEHLDHIMKYCKQDATLTSNLSEFLIDHISNMFGVIPKTLVSKTGICKELIREAVGSTDYTTKKGQPILAYPKFKLDSMAGKYAYLSYHGGIFDCKKRGYFPKVTNIDISSAYPFAMVDMPNWSNGDFIKIDSMDDIRDDDLYGWIFAAFDYPLIPYKSDSQVNIFTELARNEEILIKTTNNRIYYPTGLRFQVITMPEYRFLLEFGYLHSIDSGYIWRHNPNKRQYPKPFGWIQDVYNKKSEIKKTNPASYEYSLTKIAMNSAYGITAQTVGKPPFQNFFYASTITASTRVQIARMLEEIGYNRYITIATDGILLEGHVDLPNVNTGTLGSWDLDYGIDALILNNGIYQWTKLSKDGKPLSKPKQGTRGLFGYKGNLIGDIRKNSDSIEFYPSSKPSPLGMYRSLYWKQYSKDDMNRFMTISRKVNANSDTSKHWERIERMGDLLENQYIGRRYTLEEIQEQEG